MNQLLQGLFGFNPQTLQQDVQAGVQQAQAQLTLAFEVLIGEGAVAIVLLAMIFARLKRS